MAKLAVGAPAPDFELSGTGGQTYRLRDLRGRWVVLAFYPGDFTPVCTRQFCSYRDGADHLDQLDAQVLGISPQSVDSHERFTREHELTVPLLADPDHETAREYGVVGPGGLVRRSIFIIDPDGIVRYRHVALLGLRYRDVEHLAAALSGARMALASSSAPEPFEVAGPVSRLAGELDGEGAPVVLLHGLTATRRYVVHGSRTLARRGLRTIAYDARGHGESEPAPEAAGYAYDDLGADLGAIVAAHSPDRRCVLAGHSMGAHTLTGWALHHPDRVAALVVVGPTFIGEPGTDAGLRRWDALADGLERDGVDGFMRAYDDGLDPRWRETVLRITRERLARHRHPEAVARALREVPRSRPFDELDELEFLDLPALVVASHDDADPGHPHAVAQAWAERLPQATLVSEEVGESPLAWQGGRLSREIDAFCGRPEVRERLGA